MYTHVYPCILMYTNVYSCMLMYIPMYTNLYLRMYLHVYPCSYQCIPMYTHVATNVAIYSCNSCIFMYTHQCIITAKQYMLEYLATYIAVQVYHIQKFMYTCILVYTKGIKETWS